MARGLFAFLIFAAVAQSAAAQCYAPSQGFIGAPSEQNLLALDTGTVGLSSLQAASTAQLHPWGASGPFFSVQDTQEYEARLAEWRSGRGLAPILSVADGAKATDRPGEAIDLGDVLRRLGAENLALTIEASKKDEEGDLLLPFRYRIPAAALENEASLEGWTGWRSDFRTRPQVEQITNDDQSRPLPAFRQQPRPQPGSSDRTPTIFDRDNAANQTTPAVARAFNAVALLDINGFVCNGVHVGHGLIATNLHCAVNNARARILFGQPFQVAGKWYAPLVCSARSVWPGNAQATLDHPREDLALYQIEDVAADLAPPTDPHPIFMHFADAHDYSDVSFSPGALDPWAAEYGIAGRPLIALQVRRMRPYQGASFQFERKIEDGRWANSDCHAGDSPHPLYPACDLGSATVTAGGVEHGCDGEEGSSAMPLFVDDGHGGLVLVALHRGGVGAAPGESATEFQRWYVTWNCAVPARDIARMLASYAQGGG